MTKVQPPNQETITNLRPSQDTPGPEPTKTDLVAFLGVLALAALMAIAGTLARTLPGQATDWTAAVVVACFSAWLRLRRTSSRRWTNGAISFTSSTGRFQMARSWGTEGCPDPTLPPAPPPAPAFQNLNGKTALSKSPNPD